MAEQTKVLRSEHTKDMSPDNEWTAQQGGYGRGRVGRDATG